MGLFDFFSNKNKNEGVKNENTPIYSQFSTPFGKIGDGNLSLPYVRNYGNERYVRFGNDNLFPQLVNQMYYQSPLNGSIINYKTNAVIGGGWTYDQQNISGKNKVKDYTFIKSNKFDKLIRQITKDFILQGRITILIKHTPNGVKMRRIGPEKVRNNADKTIYTVSEDWSRSINMIEYNPYYPGCTEECMFVYELDGDAGQDIYPIPQYCSALNWCFVDGEMAYLHKSNIINSIFPSFMIKLAKKFGSEDEAANFRDTINKAKGAPAAGRILTFVANTPDQLPTIEPIPVNQNDGLFTQTDERIDANIARAHSIDPILMGIRVSGKLGSGTDIQQSYIIFEKNIILPLRNQMEECINELLFIGDTQTKIKINNYQIIGDQIVDKTKQ